MGGQGDVERECTEYHRARIAYLLGCCGDQPIDYPGPAFAPSLTRSELATRALREINAARRLRCYDASSAVAKALLLNEIGARLLRGSALPGNATVRDVKAALNDLSTAANKLRAFVASYPAGAAGLWYWVAISFKLSGQLVDSLAFLIGLPVGCCRLEDVNVMKADLYFEMGMFEASASQYSSWLAKTTPESLCGRKQSLSNATELRRRGFSVKAAPTEAAATCVVGSEWTPYIDWPIR
jgi:hypothetical protein